MSYCSLIDGMYLHYWYNPVTGPSSLYNSILSFEPPLYILKVTSLAPQVEMAHGTKYQPKQEK